MNQSAAIAIGTINGWEGHYRPVWSAKFRTVQVKGRPAYFKTPEAAECAAWRVLYSLEQRVMKRDGEVVFAAKSQAERIFRNGKVTEIERRGASA
ncbi:hypothetical protein [Rhizobium sp. BK456]|uniref:hypothetical protein n=1 Tax=Rhizobium sp. BK456 TaxID=2587007 RepID=UPI00161F8377|nr:hypothetical protein [Rhizobium sp. BK456]MBB3521073.1 hypothetical protein [Rhizobium sp. BK456]